jgi:hypothetical protein
MKSAIVRLIVPWWHPEMEARRRRAQEKRLERAEAVASRAERVIADFHGGDQAVAERKRKRGI